MPSMGEQFFLLSKLRTYSKIMDGAARTPFFLQSEIARHANLNCVWVLSYHLTPESIFPKIIWMPLGSNPGRLRDKRPLYPLHHCLSGNLWVNIEISARHGKEKNSYQV